MTYKINTKYFYFEVFEAHHLYIGIVFLSFGFIFDTEWLRTLGWINIVDDTLQHILQGMIGKDYRSPIHYLTWIFEPIRTYLSRFKMFQWIKNI